MNKTQKIFDVQIKALNDASLPSGGFEGYLSIFNNLDEVGDIVLPGAFIETIPSFIKDGWIALSHDWDELAIAYILDAYEDNTGLYIKCAFHSTDEAQEARTVMMERAAAGKSIKLSIGYCEEEAEQTPAGRLLKKLKLYEGSYVNAPANTLADVTNVKSNNLKLEDEFNQTLSSVKEVTNRLEKIKELRTKQGRVLSASNREKLEAFQNQLASIQEILSELLTTSDAPKQEDSTKSNSLEARTLYVQFLKELA